MPANISTDNNNSDTVPSSSEENGSKSYSDDLSVSADQPWNDDSNDGD